MPEKEGRPFETPCRRKSSRPRGPPPTSSSCRTRCLPGDRFQRLPAYRNPYWTPAPCHSCCRRKSCRRTSRLPTSVSPVGPDACRADPFSSGVQRIEVLAGDPRLVTTCYRRKSCRRTSPPPTSSFRRTRCLVGLIVFSRFQGIEVLAGDPRLVAICYRRKSWRPSSPPPTSPFRRTRCLPGYRSQPIPGYRSPCWRPAPCCDML